MRLLAFVLLVLMALGVTPAIAQVITGPQSFGPAWQSIPLNSYSASRVVVEFDATPVAAPLDGVLGFSAGPANSFSSLAAIIRFNAEGFIDIRNGPAYAASATVPYSANAKYHFRIVIDIPRHTYSVTVIAAGGVEQAIANSFSFRSEQSNLGELNTFSGQVSGGTITVENINASYLLPPPPRSTGSVRLAWDPSSSSDVVGYEVSMGTASRSYSAVVLVGNVTTHTVTNLESGRTYYFAVRAIDSGNLFSIYSNEVFGTIATGSLLSLEFNSPAGSVTVNGQGASGKGYIVLTSEDLVSWNALTNLTANSEGTFSLTTNVSGRQRFFRLADQ